MPVQLVLKIGSGQFGGGVRTMATVKFESLLGEHCACVIQRLAAASASFASDGMLDA